METRTRQTAITRGERADVVKREDNLHMEGAFTGRAAREEWRAAEKAEIVRREDNLHMEGEFAKKVEAEWKAGERMEVVKRSDNLVTEGVFGYRLSLNCEYCSNPSFANSSEFSCQVVKLKFICFHSNALIIFQ